ncbi:hypothetical protein Clacol_005361 [Clathrus columnatus]|uniref:Uncharacterized protein n=1 Tax=Clathrus columnatus TaxID=1419009 RepID=A0AAV5A9W2_9AGAM|nr:hypothetical protein Clacol_005361 [Clathrus columnatus]
MISGGVCLASYSELKFDMRGFIIQVLAVLRRLENEIAVCIGGLGMLVASDKLTQKDYPAVDLVKDDIFMLIGTTLYGSTNATEEFFVCRPPLYEFIFTHLRIVGLLFAYTATMFILYTVAPWIYRLAPSAYLQHQLIDERLLWSNPWLVLIPESQGKLDPQAPEYVRRRQQAAAAMVEEASIESPTKSNEDIKEPILVT